MIDDGVTLGAQSPAPRRVELRSDTFTLPTQQMLKAMIAADLGDDVYGEDPTVHALEERSAHLLGKDAACFMPSGTMGNLASILAHCPRGSKVVVGAESDIYYYEAGGASVCGAVVYHPVANLADGTMDLRKIEAAVSDDPDDPQFARPALICVENPHNRCGGVALPTSYLEDLMGFARGRGLAVHMDGSRVFNASVSTGIAADEIARYADSLQFCLSKGLGAPVGSMVVGGGEFVAAVRRLRKMLGGGMRQAGVLAAAGLVALSDLDRLHRDHDLARKLADGLAGIPGIAVEPDRVQTNMVYFRVSMAGMDNARLITAAAARGVQLAELGHGRIRSVTHCDVTYEDVDYALEVIRSALEGRSDRADRTRGEHADEGASIAG